MNAARLYFRSLRILVLVDHVLVDAFIHQLPHFGLDPGLTECGKVLPRVSVEQQLIVHQLICRGRIRLLPGKPVLGQRTWKETGPEYLVVEIREDFFLGVDRHSLTLRDKRLDPGTRMLLWRGGL